MHTLLAISLFILGTIIASGVNALVYRNQRELSWGQGADRSKCPKCQHVLAWWELVPIASFVGLGGRCAHCKKSINVRYVLVELVGGGLFLVSFLTFGLTYNLLFSLLATTLLLFMYLYDADTLLLPNWSVWSFNVLALSGLLVNLHQPLLLPPTASFFELPTWWQLAAGPAVALPFLLLWLGSGGRAMGFGDVKLALGIGWFLGLAGGASAVMYSFWIGAIVSLGLLAIQKLSSSQNDKKQLTMKSAVPFGPFLVLGFLLVYFANITLF